MSTPLATQTPSEIDTQLAELHDQQWIAFDARARARATILRVLGLGPRRDVTTENLDALEESPRAKYAVRDYRAAEARLAALKVEMEPFENEWFTRQWSRFFLVQGGHIHRSMSCSTCNKNGKGTRFAWLPELSGQTEAEAVAAHGATLCTTCWTSAPTEWTNHYEVEKARKNAEKCPGSGTSNWVPESTRFGFAAGNGGTCAVCEQWAGATPYRAIRSHKPKA